MIDVVQLVKDKSAKFEWYEVCSKYNGYTLFIKVFRDSMKFDNIPAMTWKFSQIPGDERIFNGVRLPTSAHKLQEIADLLGGMLLTPKIIDMIWLQSELTFDSVVNINGNIVATSNIHDVHNAIEKKIKSLGGDDGSKLVSCTGKYWCLMNDLNFKGVLHGDETCCNYGWCAKRASGPGITPGVRCWQRPGFRHNKLHYDPSQTIRIMHRKARLIKPDGTEAEVDLHSIASDHELAPLVHHQGNLTYLRQRGVKRLSELVEEVEQEPPTEPEIIEPEVEPEKPRGIKTNLIERIFNILTTLFGR